MLVFDSGCGLVRASFRRTSTIIVVTRRGFDAVLCDLDGVIRHWLPQEDLERRYGLPAGAIARAAFAPACLDPALSGAITDAQWRESVVEALSEVCGSIDLARVVTAAWGSPQSAILDDEIVAILAQVRRRLPVVVVTNATTRLEEDLRGSQLLTAVDAVVSSARVGAAKPDPKIYRTAVEIAGVAVDRCLFIDDSDANVRAAKALGMLGLRFQDVGQLHRVLSPVLTKDNEPR